MRPALLMLLAACLACSVRLPPPSTATPGGTPSPSATAMLQPCCLEFDCAVPTLDDHTWVGFSLTATAVAGEFGTRAAGYRVQFTTAEAHANSLNTSLAQTATQAANLYKTAQARLDQMATIPPIAWTAVATPAAALTEESH